MCTCTVAMLKLAPGKVKATMGLDDALRLVQLAIDQVWFGICSSELQHSALQQQAQVDVVRNFFDDWRVLEFGMVWAVKGDIRTVKKISKTTEFTEASSIP